MALAEAQGARRRLTAAAELAGWEAVGFAALSAIIGWWTWRGLHDPTTFDTGLAYTGGQAAWATGHPERLATWISTPFLGLVMACLTRVFSAETTTRLVTVGNLLLALGLAWSVLVPLRRRLERWAWWILAIALVSYGPLLSTVWWKQFNLMALTLAIVAFDSLRRGRDHRAAVLLALSISIKPLAVLLPVVLLVPRRTRRAGLETIAWIAVLNLLGMILYAWRAHSLAAINPYPQFHNFSYKGRFANIWACHPENFAPGSTLCRLAGAHNQTVQEVVVWVGVALLGAWIVEATRGHGARSWELFAFTMPLSVMISPVAWSHYQIMLAPLFVLLFVRFRRDGAAAGEWAGLVIAFTLASLIWQPYGTTIGALRALVSSHVQTQNDLFSLDAVAEFAQYVLLATGILWYARRISPPVRAGAPDGARTPSDDPA